MNRDNRRKTRRGFLASGVAAALAGCTVSSLSQQGGSPRSTDSGTPSGTTVGSPSTDTETPTLTETPEETETATPDASDVTPAYLGEYYPNGSLVDDMSDLSCWSGNEPLAADESVRFGGRQSLRYEGSHWMKLERTFDDPLDLSDASLSFAGYFDRPADVQPTLSITAYTDSGGECVRFAHPYTGNRDARWQRYDVAPVETKGDPDLSDVRRLVFTMYSGDDRPIRLWLDDVRTHPKPDRGKVIFRFDDSHRHHYTEYFDALHEFGYPGIEAVVKREIDRDGRLTTAQLQEMYDAGWDLCNHMVAHEDVTDLSESELRANLDEMARYFDDIGIETGKQFHIYTFGSYDGASLDVLEEYFDLGFSGGAPTNYSLTNPMLVGGKDCDHDLEGAKRLIDLAAEHRSLSIPLIHFFDEAEFRELVEYTHRMERRGDVDVINATELMGHLRSSGYAPR